MFASDDTITALEIGTSTIKAIMGKADDEGRIEILAHDEVTCIGYVSKAQVINVPALEEMLAAMFTNLETASNKRIGPIYLAISGSHIQSTNVMGTIRIASSQRTINEADLIEAVRCARSFNLPLEQKLIHTFQRSFTIDDSYRIANPVGITGNKLTADIHVIFGNLNKTETLLNLVKGVVGWPVTGIAFSPIADYYGVVMGEETDKGYLLINLGAGVTEYAVFNHQACIHSGQIAVGCDHVANDLSIGLDLPIKKCRELLHKCGAAQPTPESQKRTFKVELSLGQPPRMIKEAVFQSIIGIRLEELFNLIKADLTKTFIDEKLNMIRMIGDGIILCGGGALIPEITTLAHTIFKVPVKPGLPINCMGLDKELNSPLFTTPIGLLNYGYRLTQLDFDSPYSFRQAAQSEFVKLIDICKQALKF